MKTILMIVALALAPHANAAMICKDFLALPETERMTFVRGLHDGLAASLGIHNVFAARLAAMASTVDEKDGIQKMHLLPQTFLTQRCCQAETAILEEIAKGCGLEPALPVGNFYIDVLSQAGWQVGFGFATKP